MDCYQKSLSPSSRLAKNDHHLYKSSSTSVIKGPYKLTSRLSPSRLMWPVHRVARNAGLLPVLARGPVAHVPSRSSLFIKVRRLECIRCLTSEQFSWFEDQCLAESMHVQHPLAIKGTLGIAAEVLVPYWII